MKNILVVKETKSQETRVALLPEDIKTLINQGFKIFVEAGAGAGVGVSDSEFEKAGATIRESNLATLFKDIDIIIRAKRADKTREIQELEYIKPGTVIVGTLDPKEKNSTHIERFRLAGLDVYSLDYLEVDKKDDLNILERMSSLTGRLAVEDAISKIDKVRKIIIIGFGSAGRSAYLKACELGFDITVFCTRKDDLVEIQKKNKAYLLDKDINNLQANQAIIQKEILDADVVISSARSNKGAPTLITDNMLKQLKDIVIVDLAISDGGNVAGSQHDSDVVFANNVIVSNVSGYPKKTPLTASKLWSTSSRLFIEKLALGDKSIASSKII